MKAIFLIIMALLFSLFQCYAIHPDAIKSHRAKIAQAYANPNEENIIQLGEILLGSFIHLDNRDPVAVGIYKEIQTAVIAIPGHAEYYQKKILKAQERAKSIGPTALSEYSSELMYGFQTLPLLPSPESVRVLGELLSNEWVPPGNETAPLSGKFAPLSVSARVTLQKFSLLDKPFTDQITKENVPDAQAAWLQWFEQIKAGKRTFRFEGDPTEYDLSGPAPGQKIAHILRDEKRDAERATRQKNIAPQSEAKQSASPDKKPSLISAILASLMLCAAAIWYFMKGRKLNVE